MFSLLEYLKIVKKKWRVFYFFVILYGLILSICVFIFKHSIPPFYVYTMYSYPIPKESKNILFRIFINDKEYNTFKLLKEEGDVIRFNLNRFSQLKDENKKDKFYYTFDRFNEFTILKKINNKLFNYQNLNDETFANWLKDYLKNSYKDKITSLKIYRTNLSYEHYPKPIITKNFLLLNIDYDPD